MIVAGLKRRGATRRSRSWSAVEARADAGEARRQSARVHVVDARHRVAEDAKPRAAAGDDRRAAASRRRRSTAARTPARRARPGRRARSRAASVPHPSRRRACARQAFFRLVFASGRSRMRLPVAAKIAFSTAGAATAIVGSPTPPQKPPDGDDDRLDLRHLVHPQHRVVVEVGLLDARRPSPCTRRTAPPTGRRRTSPRPAPRSAAG